MYIKLNKPYRAIFISDIHGDIKSLKKILEEVNYKKSDYLFILGDMIEKGPFNLEVLEYCMELNKFDNVYIIVGNCDSVLIELDNLNSNLLKYINIRELSILREAINKYGLDSKNLNEIKLALKEHIEFIKSCPHIIETDDFYLAHAGLYPNANFLETDFLYAISVDMQSLVKYKYPKPLIVGHWFSCLYHTEFNLNPHFNIENNIISIDGANSIKVYGQLNALIYEDNLFSYTYVDKLKKVKVKKDQMKTSGSKIIWPYNLVEITDSDEVFYTCSFKSYGDRGINPTNHIKHQEKVVKTFVTKYKENYYSLEFNNNLLELKKGDLVSIVNDEDPLYYIVKHNGLVGLALKSNLEE